MVRFVKASRQTVRSILPTNGQVEPVEWAAARAETAGVVQEVKVQRGDEAKKGTTLVTLDSVAAKTELAAALAQREQAKAELSVVKTGGRATSLADIDAGEKAAQQTLDEARRRLGAQQRLFEKKAATKTNVQEAQDAVQRAENQIAQYRAQRKALVAPSDQSVSSAKLQNAIAAVALAQHRLDLSIIRSPIDGTIYKFDLKKGAYLNVGELVAEVGKLDQVRVIIFVDEPELGRVSKGVPVNLTWDAKPGQTWHGQVEQLPTAITALNTRKVGEVRSIIDNPNHDLLPGVNVDAEIISKVASDVIAIPKETLHSEPRGTGVYKLKGDKLFWQQVKAGVSDANYVEISSGIKQGDEIARPLAEGEMRDGMQVRPAIED